MIVGTKMVLATSRQNLTRPSFEILSKQQYQLIRTLTTATATSSSSSYTTHCIKTLPLSINRSLIHGNRPESQMSLLLSLSPREFRRGVKTSIVDWKPVKQKQDQETKSVYSRIFIGLLFLMPVISFGLGTWQVKRLRWKTDMISEAEDKLTLPPLPLPAVLNPEVATSHEFDYRRVIIKGKYRHDQEMYVGPRMRDGREGVIVVTPFERPDGKSKLLIKRGWISKDHLVQRTRPLSLPEDEIELECLLRKTPEKGSFTPDPPPIESPMYHFLDVNDMAGKTGCQPILLEELLDTEVGTKARELQGESLSIEQMEKHGVPIGSTGKVEFRNTHFQYILTWYGLSIFTTFMLISLLKQNKSNSSELKRKIDHARKAM